MTESAFSRFFKKNSGNSFTDHVTKLRMVRACELLADPKTPITEICFDVGYTNISNFNQLFRKLRGTTPSAYRPTVGEARGVDLTGHPSYRRALRAVKI